MQKQRPFQEEEEEYFLGAPCSQEIKGPNRYILSKHCSRKQAPGPPDGPCLVCQWPSVKPSQGAFPGGNCTQAPQARTVYTSCLLFCGQQMLPLKTLRSDTLGEEWQAGSRPQAFRTVFLFFPSDIVSHRAYFLNMVLVHVPSFSELLSSFVPMNHAHYPI